MKTHASSASLLLAALLCGCSPSTGTTTAPSSTAAQPLAAAQAQAEAAAQSIREYSYEQRDDFVVMMRAQLAQLNKDLNELSAKVAQSSDAVQTEARPKLAALRDEAAQLDKQIVDATQSTTSTWDKIKTESQKGYSSTKEELDKARQWAADKIAP